MSGDKESAVNLARKLLLLSLFNDEAKEAASAFKKARALIKKHELSQGDLLGAATAKSWGIDDWIRAGEAMRGNALQILAAFKDPEVQKTVSALRDLGSGVAKGIAALRKRA